MFFHSEMSANTASNTFAMTCAIIHRMSQGSQGEAHAKEKKKKKKKKKKKT
jgi:hypothetical protein